MVEEKNGVQNGTPNGDMPPQENSQKTPLTGDETPEEPKAEIKSKDETKVIIPGEEVPQEDEFRGLTKDELMKYSQDPFWKRLRIFLMFLFWAGWVAMLVIAILIIIQAPQCEPLPTLLWVQQSAILQVDIDSSPILNITTLMTTLGLTSFYLPSLISDRDYTMLNTITENYNSENLRAALQALSAEQMQMVTDYVPDPVHMSHKWADDPSYEGLLMPTGLADGSYYLNYSNTDRLTSELQNVFEGWKTEYNVTGFLVPEAEVRQFPEVVNITDDLNAAMEGEQIAVSPSTVSLEQITNSLDDPSQFKDFLTENVGDWHYYQFNPVGEDHRPNTKPRMTCVTLSLMLFPCTPILQVTDLHAFETELGSLIEATADLRTKPAIQFGDTQFANTTDNVIAYTRTRKGTPGYAVVVNMGSNVANSTETVNFSELDHVPDSGEMVYSLNGEPAAGAKVSLSDVSVAPQEGKVILFVAEY